MKRIRHKVGGIFVFIILLDLIVYLMMDVFHHLINKAHNNIAVRMVDIDE
jgi:hypothetical protein